MFNEDPTPSNSPLPNNDHPELDESDLLSPDDVTKYQSIIGSLQWAISLGHFDVPTAVMTLSRFRVALQKGHLSRCKNIVGYLKKWSHGAIRVQTKEPDYSGLPNEEYPWIHTVYGKVTEHLPDDAPEPLGNPVITTTYKDANLFHDFLTGRAVTGILHLLNKTPID